MGNVNNKAGAEILLQRAEDLLKSTQPGTGSFPRETEMLKVIEDLVMYQKELETQNEDLRLTDQALKDQVEKSNNVFLFQGSVLESDKKYRSLYDSIKDGVVMVSLNGHILECNQAYLDMFGYTMDEIRQLTYQQLTPAKWHEPEATIVKTQILSRGYSDEYEKEYICKDGTIRPISLRVWLIEDHENNPSMMWGIARDITEQKNAEQKLRENEALYRSMLSNISDVIGIMGADGLMKYKSPNIERFFGWLPEERIGTSGFSTIHPDDIEVVQKVFYQLLEKENSTLTFEFRYQCKDGSFKPVELHAVNRLDDPLVKGILLNYRDISERKNAEEILRSNEARLHVITDTAQDAMMMIDNQGLISYWNPAAERILGYTSAEAMGQNLHTLIVPSHYHAGHAAAFPLFQRTGQGDAIGKTLDLEARKKDGNEISVQLSLSATQVKGDWHAVGIMRDITERKLREEEMFLKNEELGKLNAEKDKFFSIIAHDLRSPFNVFLNFTRVLADDLPAMSQEQIQKFARLMNSSAINLYSLLENLLEWSRLNRGVIKFYPSSFVLLPQVNMTLEHARESVQKKEIKITCNITGDLMVFADERMLASILRNLTSNAIKFTPKGGNIEISAKPVQDNSVEISIRDTGIGMNKNMLDRLFRIDETINRPGTEDEASTGLGLIISKDFIDKHGGKISVESEEGKGTAFYLRFPAQPASELPLPGNEIQPGLSEHKQSAGLKVLIVEDDEASKMVLSFAIKKSGYKVLEAGTGDEAVKACRDNPDIDLILMDIRLPGMNGIDATRQIRQFNKEVVIIAQSAYVNDLSDIIQQIIDAGCTDFIAKPIMFEDLKRLIRKYFDR